MERSRIYPLDGKATARLMTFPDASGVPASMLPVSDGTAFDQLKRLVDSEGAGLGGPDWLGMLAAIGIVKGKPFNSDAHTRQILDRAARTAYKMSRVVAYEDHASGISYRVYPDRIRWLNPFADGTPANLGGAKDLAWNYVAGAYPYLALDARIWMFSNYYSLSPGMVSQSPGKGAEYMIAFNDGVGTPLSGGSNYRLHLPANIPAAMFWSVTLYEAENASGLANGRLSRRSVPRTSPRRTLTAARSSTSAPKRPRARKATGSRPCLARDISPFSGFTGRPKQPSTKAGSQARSRRWSDVSSENYRRDHPVAALGRLRSSGIYRGAGGQPDRTFS